jgi:dTDP-4-dehydrorhamnose 3,5-epimerase-like enzyme
MFVVRDVPVGTTRGGHAHRSQRHLLICLAGKVVVDVRVEGDHRSFVLDQPQTGLLVESECGARKPFAADGSILVGLASAPYDRNDYQTEESQAS